MLLLAMLGQGLLLPSSVSAATAEQLTATDDVAIPSAFAARKNRFIESLLARRGGWWDTDAQKGLVLLQRAKETRDFSRVGEANNLLYNASNLLDDGIEESMLVHGGAFTFLRAVLLFRDRTDLLFPATREKLVNGRRHDGSVNAQESLLRYRDEMFNRQNGLQFDLLDGAMNPWHPEKGRGTENHKLQAVVTGMLLSEVYAGQSFRGRPVKDGSPSTDDFWHYFRSAFLRYSGSWGNSNHMRSDVSDMEKDSLGYYLVYLGDYWMLRDLYSDPIIKAHAEILIDRTLADFAEDSVAGMYTGYSGRHYHRDHTPGRTAWVLNYLLFDNLGYPAEVNGRYGLGWHSTWGGWAHTGIATSDYNPTNPTFPRALIDLARNKENGYMATSGRRPQSNWVEQDAALGFLASGVGSYDSHAGGFYVQGALRGGGLNVAPFYGDEPLPEAKGKPYFSTSSVMGRRVAITRNANALKQGTRIPLGKLWVSYERDSNGKVMHQFDAVQPVGPWLFLREHAEGTGRDVYLAVRPASGGFRRLADVEDGQVYELTESDVATVWEMSTSRDHASFEAFKADVSDNALRVDGGAITYTASQTNTTLTYNRSDNRSHSVNGTRVDWRVFEHGFHTPFSSNPHGTATATLSKNGYSATYEWDADGDGNYDEMPSKRVDNTRGADDDRDDQDDDDAPAPPPPRPVTTTTVPRPPVTTTTMPPPPVTTTTVPRAPQPVRDATPPITGVAAPLPGATVRGRNIVLSAAAGDNVGIEHVRFVLSGNGLETQLVLGYTHRHTNYGWLVFWDSLGAKKVPNGTYSLRSSATDTTGNTTRSTPITITVRN